jgi:hypothetical protein
MRGLNRTDLNKSGINYLHGFLITYLPIDGYAQPGNEIDYLPVDGYAFPGNLVTWLPHPSFFGNPVTWATPNPAHFGNIFDGLTGGNLLQEDGVSLFLLEGQGVGVSGWITLET